MTKGIEYEDENTENPIDENNEDSLDFDEDEIETKKIEKPKKKEIKREPEHKPEPEANMESPQILEVPRVVSIEQMLNMIYERQEAILSILQQAVQTTK